jgi:hypothetical protein
MAISINAFSNAPEERLLKALAEQLKSPFLQIAREAELAQMTEATPALRNIEYTADMALRLIDGYLLSLRLQALPVLDLEPVSVSGMLQDTAQRLNHLAKLYDCDLELDIAGRYGPVMAHRQSLEAAYVSLGYAFIESVPPTDHKHRVVLAARSTSKGLVTGVFGAQPALSANAFKRSKALYGNATQPLPALSAHNGAGIFVANSLLEAMASSLRVARHQKLNGLAATLLPSQQLQLI